MTVCGFWFGDLMQKQFLKYSLICIAIGFFTVFCFKDLPSSFNGVEPSDFPNYYFAAQRWLNGTPVYPDLAPDVKAALGWDYKAYPADPPITIVLLAPLASLPFEYAAITLLALSVIIVALSIFAFCRENGFSILNAAVFAALAIGSSPFCFLLKRAHMEGLLLALCVFGFIAINRGSQRWGGAFWGLAASLKLFPLLWLLPAIVGAKHRQVAISGIISFLSFSALGAWLLGASNTEYFLTHTIARSREWYGAVGNYSIISVSTAIIGVNTGLLVGAAISGMLGIILFLKLRAKSCGWIQAFALCTTGALVLSPLSWLNYLILAFPAIILTFRSINLANRAELITFGLISIPIWNWPSLIPTTSPMITILLSTVPLLSLLLLMGWWVRKTPGTDATP